MKKNHFSRFLFALLASHALLACGVAQAAISCNVTSNGFSVAYVPANTSTNITTASFTMTCTRSASGDATSQAYTVKANTGLQPAAGSPQGASGANRIPYGIYIDSGCATRWKNPTTLPTLGGTITFTSSSDFTPRSQNIAFYGCILGGQTTVPAGTYTDTITMTPNPGSAATFPVSIVTPSSCSISTSPGAMTFNYTSLGTAASTSTTFATTCTSLLPYTMTLDGGTGPTYSYTDALLNLTYSLTLTNTSQTGTGAAQTYAVTGTMASGQSGQCATVGGVCNNSTSTNKTRTLTIAY